LVACFVAAFAVRLSQQLSGVGQELFSIALLAIAVVMRISYTVWMAHGRELAQNMGAMGKAV
jgi:hypothetical protein